MESYFRSYIETLKAELDSLDYKSMQDIIQVLLQARENDKQVFVFGNGGSAATASHFICDVAKGTVVNFADNQKRFRAMSLNDNIAMLTAYGNDISYDVVFLEQLKNYLKPNDVVILISASGNSKNILSALEYIRKVGAISIGLLGFGGGIASTLVDYQLTIQSRNYGISEDFHLIAGHIMTQIIKNTLTQELKHVIFLDRDGVINLKAREHDYIKTWHEFKFYPGVFDALRKLQQKDYHFVIASNQRGIGRGLFSIESLEKIHDKMVENFSKENIEIDRVYYCPHDYKDRCDCRKPSLGMFYRALNELPYSVNLSNSYVVGDSDTDIEAGKKLGTRTVFVKNGSLKNPKSNPDFVVKDLLSFAEMMK